MTDLTTVPRHADGSAMDPGAIARRAQPIRRPNAPPPPSRSAPSNVFIGEASQRVLGPAPGSPREPTASPSPPPHPAPSPEPRRGGRRAATPEPASSGDQPGRPGHVPGLETARAMMAETRGLTVHRTGRPASSPRCTRNPWPALRTAMEQLQAGDGYIEISLAAAPISLKRIQREIRRHREDAGLPVYGFRPRGIEGVLYIERRA